MGYRLHRGGRLRGRLGAALGGDAALGDRAWRRILHLLGGLVVLYYLLPPRPLGVPNEALLLAGLAVVLALEALRHLVGLEMPTVRPVEARRPASYAYFAIALVAAVLLFPEPIGAVVALGTALIDPLIGELRGSRAGRRWYPLGPFAAYAALAALLFRATTGWSGAAILLLALLGAGVALAAERPKWRWVDDDLLMTLAPAVVLLAAAAALTGLR